MNLPAEAGSQAMMSVLSARETGQLALAILAVSPRTWRRRCPARARSSQDEWWRWSNCRPLVPARGWPEWTIPGGRGIRAAQHGRERHKVKQPGVSGGDQFLRVGAGSVFKARGERIGRVVQDASRCGERALASFEVAVPDGGCSAFHNFILFSAVRLPYRPPAGAAQAFYFHIFPFNRNSGFAIDLGRAGKRHDTMTDMNLDDTQRQKVAAWTEEGLKLAEIQKRFESELRASSASLIQEVRLLVDDLKLKPKDPPPPAKLGAENRGRASSPVGSRQSQRDRRSIGAAWRLGQRQGQIQRRQNGGMGLGPSRPVRSEREKAMLSRRRRAGISNGLQAASVKLGWAAGEFEPASFLRIKRSPPPPPVIG